MTNPAAASAKATVDIDADPATVYRLITDLRTLAELAEETSAMEWKKGDDARPGAVFVGRNRNGSRSWSTTCTVTDATPGQVFAFDVRSTVIPVAHWRYEISPTASGAGSPRAPGTGGRGGSGSRPAGRPVSATGTPPMPRTSPRRCAGSRPAPRPRDGR